MNERTMSEWEWGKRYRLAQAKRLLDLFEDAHGRHAGTIRELEQWVASPQGRAATAYDRDKNGKIIPDLSGEVS